MLTKNIKRDGKKGTMKKIELWNNTMDKKFNEPTQSKTVISINPKQTS
jgi:hypothetical protein